MFNVLSFYFILKRFATYGCHHPCFILQCNVYFRSSVEMSNVDLDDTEHDIAQEIATVTKELATAVRNTQLLEIQSC